MKYSSWVVIPLLLSTCATVSGQQAQEITSLPPDSFLQDKILEVGATMKLSLAYENRDEGLFIWRFNLRPLGSGQAGTECVGLFTWYIKRVGNKAALHDPVLFKPGYAQKVKLLQEEFKRRWLGLVGPVTLIGPTEATHPVALQMEVLGRLI